MLFFKKITTQTHNCVIIVSMKVREDINQFIKTLPDNVTLVAATKYVDENVMRDLYKHNIKEFGENRVDAFLSKYDELKDLSDITWHFIGHLQRNKALKVINKIDYLHSLDSLELADLIDKNRNTPLKVFVEVSINLEDSKNGVPYYEAKSFIKSLLIYKNIQVVGLMMMTIKNSDGKDNQFRKLNELRLQIQDELGIVIPYLSMGMSDDYLDALKEGATHIRLGRILYSE